MVCTYVDSDEGILSLQQGERCQVLGEVGLGTRASVAPACACLQPRPHRVCACVQEENGWIRIKTSKGMQGYFPASYLDTRVYGPSRPCQPSAYLGLHFAHLFAARRPALKGQAWCCSAGAGSGSTPRCCCRCHLVSRVHPCLGATMRPLKRCTFDLVSVHARQDRQQDPSP